MTKQLMLGTAIAALMLSGAFAQSDDSKAKPEASPPAASQTDKGNMNKPATGEKADFVMSQKPDQWLASNFRGTDVFGADNQKIGDVSDILFDKSGKIEAYVISVGGILGIGAKDVALPPSAFDVVPGSEGKSDMLKLSMSQDELKQAQNFKPYHLPRPAVTTGSRPGGALPGMRPSGGAQAPSPSSGR